MKTELIGMYSESYDMTFVVRRKTDAVGNLISQEVTGFYHGEPTAADNEFYDGKPMAIYTEFIDNY